jgi:hypothetical protein
MFLAAAFVRAAFSASGIRRSTRAIPGHYREFSGKSTARRISLQRRAVSETLSGRLEPDSPLQLPQSSAPQVSSHCEPYEPKYGNTVRGRLRWLESIKLVSLNVTYIRNDVLLSESRCIADHGFQLRIYSRSLLANAILRPPISS